MLKYTTFKGKIGMLRLEDIKELDKTDEELAISYMSQIIQKDIMNYVEKK